MGGNVSTEDDIARAEISDSRDTMSVDSFQLFWDRLCSNERKIRLDEHMKRCVNIDMPLNWTEIGSVLFYLSLKKVQCYLVSIQSRYRQDTFAEYLKTKIADESIDIHVVGSLAEEVYIPGHSDWDIMFVSNEFECYEELPDKNIGNSNTTTFISDRRNASAGYTLLWDFRNITNQCFHYGDDGGEITINPKSFLKYDNEDSLVTVSFPDKDIKAFPLKYLIINQNETKNIFLNAAKIPVSITGPAVHAHCHIPTEFLQEVLNTTMANCGGKSEPKRLEEIASTFGDFDCVFAIPFKSKTVIQQWSGRRRRHNWPPQELLQEISQMSGYVVPVGKKGSTFEKYEFRICYTLAEIKLLRSLGEVQMLLYFILRVYAKDRKTKFPNISSYIIKNFVLWLAESVDPSFFKIQNMIPLLKSTLQVIKRCAERGSLPNYMIPSRNLFDGKVEEEERRRLINEISNVNKEGCDEILMQFESPILDIIKGIRFDKLHTFVQELKDMQKKSRQIYCSKRELRNGFNTVLYLYRLCGPRFLVPIFMKYFKWDSAT